MGHIQIAMFILSCKLLLHNIMHTVYINNGGGLMCVPLLGVCVCVCVCEYVCGCV